jgi:hypothetical protein
MTGRSLDFADVVLGKAVASRSADNGLKVRPARDQRVVDVRISRSVRAAGFRGDIFRRTRGYDRYVWMPRLGNKQAGTEGGLRIQIKDPAAASDLLSLALEKTADRRRVIFFCACEWPAIPGEDHNCQWSAPRVDRVRDQPVD